MKLLLLASLVLSLGLVSFASEPILPPSSYPPGAQAALQSGIDAITKLLNSGYPVSQSRLRSLGFGEEDFIRFVAGTLDSSGYPVKIVSVDDWGGSPHSFLLVGIDLGDDGFAWIPVEADPSFLDSFWVLGKIPWEGDSTDRFSPDYLSYDRVVEEVSVSQPKITLLTPGSPVINDSAAIMVMVNGASVVAYRWSIDGEEEITSISPTIWHTFTEAGEHTVSVTVIDLHGARATASGTFEVLEKRHQCHCSNP